MSLLPMRNRLVVAVAMLFGCSEPDGMESGSVIDTLPGGIVRVATTTPLDAGRWSLVHERDLQPPPASQAELLDPVEAELADDGTLYVVERSPVAVRRYARDGTLVGVLGREGEGPGEYRSASIAIWRDTLYVQDHRLRRLSWFDRSTGQFLGSAPSACCYPAALALDDRGNAVVRSGQTTAAGVRMHTFIRLRADRPAHDTILIPDRRPSGPTQWNLGKLGQFETFHPIPMLPSTHAVADRKGFLVAWGGEFAARVTTNGIDTIAMFTRTWRPRPISMTDKQRLVETAIASLALSIPGADTGALRAAMDPEEIPDLMPAILEMLVGPSGHRWVRSPGVSPDSTQIDIFDREGRWRDQLHVATAAFPVGRVTLTTDRVVVVASDDDGRPLIRVYRVVIDDR